MNSNKSEEAITDFNIITLVCFIRLLYYIVFGKSIWISAMIQWIIYMLGVFIVFGSDQVASAQFNYSTFRSSTSFGLPGGCLDTLNCLAVVNVVKINPDAYRFDVQAIPSETNQSPVYVAIGLSLDASMGDDSVVECVAANNQIEVFMSYTKQSPRSADRHTYTDEITVTNKSYVDGSIHCIFERKAVTDINNQTFDLNQKPYHLLLAIGNEVDVDSLMRHTVRLSSSEPLIVPEIGDEVPDQTIDYHACGRTQTCFGMPSGCVAANNCHTAVTIMHTSPTYKFQMVTRSGAAYVAVGLSMDNKMGNDSVVECVRENGTVNMYTSYTLNDHMGSDRHPSTGLATLLNSSYVDGAIYCYVERTETGAVFGQEFDLNNQPFYILLSIGDVITTTSLKVHKQRQVSSQAINLWDIVDLTVAAKPLLVKLHGSFMIFAWMGTAAVGLVLARYFKSEWSDKAIFGKDLWFIGHITCMVITWTLTLVAFVVIFVHVGGWTQIGRTHGILGTVVTILCFFQPIGAAFRPNPKHPRRYLFNISHYFTGRVAFLLAIVNIFYAIFLSTAEMPIWFISIMVMFVIVFWGNHILMSTMEYLSGSRTNLLRAFIGPAKRIDYATADYRAWYVRLKINVFVLYLAGIITLVVGSVCVVIFNRN